MNKELSYLEQLKSFKEAISLTSMFFILDKNKFVIEVNKKLCEYLGFTEEELLNRHINTYRSGYHPESFYEELWGFIEKNNWWKGEIRVKNKAGEFLWLDTSVNTIFNSNGEIDGYFYISYDITAKKENEKTLIQQKDELSLLTDSSPIFILKVDKNYKIIFINRTGPETSKEEIIGINILDLVIPRERNRFKEYIDEVFNSGKVIQFEMLGLNTIKEPWWFRANIGPIKNNDGDIEHVVFLTENINELKKTQRKLNSAFAEYKTIIENSPLQIVKLNRNYEIVFINKVHGDINIENVIGKKYTDLALPEYKEIATETLEAVFIKQEKRNIILKGRRFVGDERWFQINVSPVVKENKGVEFAILNVEDITDSVEQKETLAKKELQLTSLAKNSPLLIVTLNKDFEVLFSNNEYFNSHSSVTKIKAIDFIHPLYHEYAKKIITQVFETGEQEVVNIKGYSLDRTQEIWIRAYVAPVKNNNNIIESVILNIQDVTHLIETQDKLKESEANFKSLANNIPVNIIKVNKNYIIDYVNNPNTSFNINSVVGDSIFSSIPESEQNFVKSEIDIVLKTGEQRYYERVHHIEDGKKIWISTLMGPAYDVNGKISGVIKAIRDITYRIKDEEEKEALISDLMKKNNDLNQFTYIISHNLRAPISNILGLCSIIADDKNINKEDLQEISKLIHISAKNLDGIIKDLSKTLSASSNIAHTKQEMFFSEIIDQSLRLLKKEIEDSNAQISYNIQPNATKITCNKVFIESIFYNLLSNAIKYRCLTCVPEIDIVICKQETNTVIYFSDNGIGIDLNKHKNDLFKFYKRFHTHIDGKGMGLYMVKSQVVSMGGTIDVESAVNKGTRFIVSFPD